jgi:uncharacterized Fe-S cluster-containing radical SAM superfamily protein
MATPATTVPVINTRKFSQTLRERSIDLAARRILVTNFHGTEQERDFTVPANCRGFGRVRHFRRETSPGWPPNPLPIDPACKALGLDRVDKLRSQLFQNAACNWRCWYCYVPFKLLSADKKSSTLLSAGEMIEMYLAELDRPAVIDLSGGQPDLVPEWVPWMMEELARRGLQDAVYLWSDDNLSNDFFWHFLSDAQRRLVASYRNYGRVCCFKGFDVESFQFNTCAAPELFDQQFALMNRFVELGIDLYGYVTLTTPSGDDLAGKVARFVDRLQQVADHLPLRTVPLEIRPFTPVKGRIQPIHEQALEFQQEAVAAWNSELNKRFAGELRALPICDVPLKSHRIAEV